MTRLGMADWGNPHKAGMLLLALLAGALGWASLGFGMPAWRVLVLLLVAPLAEEAVFRAGLHDGLLHNGVAPWLANLLTALAFGVAHLLLLGIKIQTALVWLPALLIGAAYNRWRRLCICIALHMAMNALWIAVQGMKWRCCINLN
jgi:membrane protease YdiL (CAAX protease family)